MNPFGDGPSETRPVQRQGRTEVPRSPEERRGQLLAILRSASGPITGADLAERLGVTRQVIVQDIAHLRTAGHPILATLQGYLLLQRTGMYTDVVLVKHTKGQIEDELNTIVDCGGTVVDVVVEHPLYGELRGTLLIRTREDVRAFLESMAKTNAEPLSSLTRGVHYHTIEAPSLEILGRVRKALREKGYLVESKERETP
ncbi:MAG: transcription repressor NadR [Armatimonadota bacterium]|nr:transcription repressor NadR [Armatimonadota bacterium]MDR7433669.1 transcription repressor NadR [Armatimonadota bacterium]